LKRLIIDLHLENVVHFTGYLDTKLINDLYNLCDVYIMPSRELSTQGDTEGFGITFLEANACEKPVIAIDAMAFRDTMVHGETAFLAKVAEEKKISEGRFGQSHGIESDRRIVFPNPRTAEYRASVPDIAKYLRRLMQDSALRENMGDAGRRHVVEFFDYRQVAKRFVEIVSDRLGID
jgi:glycosyltransferase involved in cell wall biosynthesis